MGYSESLGQDGIVRGRLDQIGACSPFASVQRKIEFACSDIFLVHRHQGFAGQIHDLQRQVGSDGQVAAEVEQAVRGIGINFECIGGQCACADAGRSIQEIADVGSHRDGVACGKSDIGTSEDGVVGAATENDDRRHAHAAVVGHLGSAAVHRNGGHVVRGHPVDVARAGIAIVESDGVAFDFAGKFSQQVGFHGLEFACSHNAWIAVLHEKLQNHRISSIEVRKQVLHIAIAVQAVEVHRRRLCIS